MTRFIEKILDKTRKWVLALAFLKAFFIPLIGLSLIVDTVILWPLRSLLVTLGMLGLTLGTLSIYLDIVGTIYYLVKKRREDRIFIWALLPHSFFFFYGVLVDPIFWFWDKDVWYGCLNYIFGGPYLWREFFFPSLQAFLNIVFHPTYIPSPFKE